MKEALVKRVSVKEQKKTLQEKESSTMFWLCVSDIQGDLEMYRRVRNWNPSSRDYKRQRVRKRWVPHNENCSKRQWTVCVKQIALDLSVFIIACHFLSQSGNTASWKCIIMLAKCNIASSAKSERMNLDRTGRLFVYKGYKRGTRTDPFGMPEMMGCTVEYEPSSPSRRSDQTGTITWSGR